MRSYTNSKGEKVNVSSEHLDIAVKIKDELQKLSPNMRCNWKTHKKMMIEEGYKDSDKNESYRCMIKDYQSKNGTINTKEKMADLVSDKKLDSIKNAVGELYYNKREVQIESQKLGKLKREITLLGVVAEEISESVNNYLRDFDVKVYKHVDYKEENRMIVVISDWHIGAVVDNVYGNSYNYQIATERVEKLYNKVKKIALENNVKTITIASLGDMTEHISMRNVNQSFESEFNMSEQIVKSFDLVKNFTLNLLNNFNIEFTGVSGNHDRINGRKEDNVDGDSTIKIINHFMKEFIDATNKKLPKGMFIRYIESDNINYSSIVNINGRKIKFVHGDNERHGRGRILSSHSALDGEVYNLVIMGHVHHFEVTEVGQNQFEVYSGSLMGQNNYAVKSKFSSTPSQSVVLIDKNGEIDIRRVGL